MADQDQSLHLWYLWRRRRQIGAPYRPLPARNEDPSRFSGGTTALRFSPDGDHVAGLLGGSAILWSTRGGGTRKLADTRIEPTSIAFTPDGRRVVVGTDVDAEVFDAPDGRHVGTFHSRPHTRSEGRDTAVAATHR